MFNLEEERLRKENNDLKDKVESLEEIFNQNLTSELVLKGYLNLMKGFDITYLYQNYKKIYIDLFAHNFSFNILKFFIQNYPGDLTRVNLEQILQNEFINNTTLNNILLEINRNDLIHNFVCTSNDRCINKIIFNGCNSIRFCWYRL